MRIKLLRRPAELTITPRFPSQVLVACGLGLLSLDLPAIAVALVLHGAGMGIMSIARGTVPLALFGVPGYAVLMGRLASPRLLAQAISPLVGAVMLEAIGATEVLLALCGVALANVVLVAILALCATRSQSFSG
jgi:hypothetical protein